MSPANFVSASRIRSETVENVDCDLARAATGLGRGVNEKELLRQSRCKALRQSGSLEYGWQIDMPIFRGGVSDFGGNSRVS
jgi:hypothetical protein